MRKLEAPEKCAALAKKVGRLAAEWRGHWSELYERRLSSRQPAAMPPSVAVSAGAISSCLLALALLAAVVPAQAAVVPGGIPTSVRVGGGGGGGKEGKGKARSATSYNGEIRKTLNQTHKALKGSSLKPLYGLLPSGTPGSIEDYDDVAAVVVGDSFTGPLVGVFDDIARARGVKFALTTIPSCAAFFDKVSMDHTIEDWPVAHRGKAEVVDCKRVRRQEMLELVRRTKADTVFLGANWVASSQLWTARDSGDDIETGEDPVTRTLQAVAATGKKVAVFGVVPGAHYNVRACMAGEEAAPGGGARRCPSVSRVAPPFEGDEKERKRMQQRVEARKTLARIFAAPAVKALGVRVVDPARAMCPAEDKCLVALHGEPLYSDSFHLTMDGGRMMRKDIERVLDGKDA